MTYCFEIKVNKSDCKAKKNKDLIKFLIRMHKLLISGIRADFIEISCVDFAIDNFKPFRNLK